MCYGGGNTVGAGRTDMVVMACCGGVGIAGAVVLVVVLVVLICLVSGLVIMVLMIMVLTLVVLVRNTKWRWTRWRWCAGVHSKGVNKYPHTRPFCPPVRQIHI